MLLSGAARLDDAAAMRPAIATAVEQGTTEIGNPPALIPELAPAALDQLGLLPALSSLVQRTASTTGLEIESDLDLGAADARMSPEFETPINRLSHGGMT